MHSLYRGLGRQLFAYATPESGIGPATLPYVGFGVVFFDADHDMQLDLAFANGHIIDNARQFRAGASHAQRKLLFRNAGSRRFTDVTADAGPGFTLEKVGRGLAAGTVLAAWSSVASASVSVRVAVSPVAARTAFGAVSPSPPCFLGGGGGGFGALSVGRLRSPSGSGRASSAAGAAAFGFSATTAAGCCSSARFT